MKTIWIINQYASLPKTGVGGRHRHLARELAKRGHRVYVIAARWTHFTPDDVDDTALPLVEEFEGFSFVHVPVPRYRDAHDKRRVLNWFLFAWRIMRLPQTIPHPPDVVLCSSPSPFAFLGAERLARRFGARLVFEVRDIWPLSLQEIGGKSPRHPLIRVIQWIEDRAYRNAERVISNLEGAVEHMVARGMDRKKFAWIPNGFSRHEVEQPLPETILSKLPSARFLIGYTGTIGQANALDVFIDAAERLRNVPEIALVLVGKGRERPALEAQVKQLGLQNVFFLDPVPKAQVQAMLQRFDACFIASLDIALYRFGIAANKLFDYLYSARPTIHGYSGGYHPVVKYDAGLQVPPGDAAALADGIMRLYAMSAQERRRLGENGRRAVMERHEYAILAEQLEAVLLPDADQGHAVTTSAGAARA